MKFAVAAAAFSGVAFLSVTGSKAQSLQDMNWSLKPTLDFQGYDFPYGPAPVGYSTLPLRDNQCAAVFCTLPFPEGREPKTQAGIIVGGFSLQPNVKLSNPVTDKQNESPAYFTERERYYQTFQPTGFGLTLLAKNTFGPVAVTLGPKFSHLDFGANLPSESMRGFTTSAAWKITDTIKLTTTFDLAATRDAGGVAGAKFESRSLAFDLALKIPETRHWAFHLQANGDNAGNTGYKFGPTYTNGANSTGLRLGQNCGADGTCAGIGTLNLSFKF
ncbi:MAG: hypothetical protein KGQ41_07170 [Alphaproteobacteria bacterium]|nr:hypothetical protein [Alphaproteobacteria bacterium]